jgi:hypothetical protein
MNPYQKFGTFLVRIVGLFVALIGVYGPIYGAVSKGLGRGLPSYPVERWVASLIWAVSGVVLLLAGKPIGRLLGRDLE